jgi:hypothetical protein
VSDSFTERVLASAPWIKKIDGQREEIERLRKALYLCIKELDYVQSGVENCHSGLCASAMGKELVEKGMKLLGVSHLSKESLEDRVLRR